MVPALVLAPQPQALGLDPTLMDLTLIRPSLDQARTSSPPSKPSILSLLLPLEDLTLDMCSCPGSKTTLLLELMHPFAAEAEGIQGYLLAYHHTYTSELAPGRRL
jgi:hypothetical protein